MSQILGIDYGSKRIGLALADEETAIAMPYTIMENKGWQENLQSLQQLIKQEEIKALVIGYPVSLSGKETDQTGETKKFFNLLQGVLKIPIYWQDERLTSKQVDSLVGQFKKHVDRDAVAAMLILQTYLDKQK